MKIGIIPPITKTGEGRYGEYLINGLKENGFDVEVLDNSILLKRPNIKMFLGSLLFKKILKGKNLPIIHNLDNLGPFLVKQNLESIKTIQNVFDIAPVIMPDIHDVVIKFNFRYILPKLIENSDSVIVSSNSTKKDLILKFGVDKNKINLIPLGVDNSVFYPRSSYDVLLKKYGINHDYLMYVGGDSPRKNLKNLILAFIKIFQDIPHDLILVGPVNKKNIVRIIKSHSNLSSYKILNRIVMLGYVDNEDLAILYSAASAFVYLSLYEGFGLPPLEAMACGTPVIVSKNSSLEEVVGKAGIYLNNPLNLDEISKKILELVNDNKLQKKLINTGFKQINKFKWEHTVNKTINVYEDLLSK